MSIIFYAWGAPKFVFILLGAVIVDYFMALQIAKADEVARKYWLLAAVSINLSILLYFKYANFFVENFCLILGCSSKSFAQILLPIGISFFTFHEISYLTDVYRKVKEPFKNIVNYALYIFLFPQLIAGPIIRFHEIADQIENRKHQSTIETRILGIFRFSVGLAKKVLIADVLGSQVTTIFALSSPDLATAWTGVFLNLLSIYFDFSGYSDMAIGLALTMGFRIPENFNSPLIAESMTEFWRRWHISLSNWFREYIFIPLGGNQKSESITQRNIFIIFLVSGIWHGASWNFVIWGIIHGMFVMAEKLFLLNLLNRLVKPLRIIYTVIVFSLLLVLFTHKNLQEALNYFHQLFYNAVSAQHVFISAKVRLVLLVAIFLAFGSAITSLQKFTVRLFQTYLDERNYLIIAISAIVLIAFSASMLFISGYQPFLYFKF